MCSRSHFFLLVLIHLAISASSVGSKANANEDSKQVEELYDKAWTYLEINLDSAIAFAEQQKDLAISKNYELGLIKAYYIIGYINYLNKYFDQAALNYYKGLKLAQGKDNEIYKKREMLLLQNLAIVYEEAYNRDTSLQYALEALKLAEELKSDNQVILSYNIGVIYEKKENYDKSKEWYKKVLQFENLDNDRIKAMAYNSFGNVCNKTQEYENAKTYYLLAIETVRKTNDLQKEVDTYISNLGENAFRQNNFKLAKEYYEQALSISEEFGSYDKIKWLNNNLGDVYLKEKNYEEAISFYNKSIALGHSENIDEELKRSYQNIAKAYDALGNFQLASQFKDKYMGQAELLAQTRDKLQEQNAQYRMREVEWQMERLAKNEQIQFYQTSVFWFRISLSLIILVLVMISYFTYKNYRKIALARRLLNY